MDSKSFSLKLALISSLIASGSALAQNLPDEINHTRYLQIYQNLDNILQQKTAEFNRLSSQKSQIEEQIAQMERDQVEIPARNSELTQVIANKRAEVSRLTVEISQIESTLSQVIEDLRRIDSIIAQLSRDYTEQANRLRSIESTRSQATVETNNARARLEREMHEEAQTGRQLQRLTNEFNQAQDQRQQNERERRELTRDVDRARNELPNFRASITQNTNLLNQKKPILADMQSKLPAIKQDVATQQAKVNAAEANLSPERNKLAQLNNNLNSINSQIAALTTENQQLTAKIAQNRVRMANMNNATLQQAKERLEAEVAQLTQQSASIRTSYEQNMAGLTEKNTLLAQKKAELRNHAPRTPDFLRIAIEIKQIEKDIENIEDQLKRQRRALAPIDQQIASKNQQIVQYTNAMAANDQQRVQLANEITAAEAKIAENTQAIASKQAAKNEAQQAVTAQQAVVKNLEDQKAAAARELAKSQALETQLTNQINVTSGEIQRLEKEIAETNKRIAEMEQLIAGYPQQIQRLDNHNRQLDQRIMEARRDINTHERLLARIQQDRVQAQQVYDAVASRLEQINHDYNQTDAQARMLQQKISENQQQRDSLTRYNQDSIRRYDALKASKDAAEKEIADASHEMNINEQDLNTISQQLPKLRVDLQNVTPRVNAALAAKNDAESRAQTASVDYQNRRALFDRYLGEARELGQERGIVGTESGSHDGLTEARNVAQRLSQENGAAEGKWEAIRRGYTRGEISGFSAGYEIGMASQGDIARGEQEGLVAGAKRAKDEANNVKKPQIYLDILAQRLREDEVTRKKLVSDIVSSKMAHSVHAFQNEVPDLTDEEIARGHQIISSLDAMIAQSEVEIKKVLDLRTRIQDSRNVYNAPTSAPGAQNGDCSGVYKNVKDFVEACKSSFAARYQSLYNSSHAESFHAGYANMFRTSVERVADAELIRLYGTYSAEATKVGREVGIAHGKEEIYKQSFARAEMASYNENAPKEEARVTNEADALVQDHLAKNPALAQKEEASLATANQFGISPGVEGSIKLAMKNIGNMDSNSSSLIRVTEVSQNLVMDQKESVLPNIAGRSQKEVNVLKVKVADMAVPGSRVVIAGEIVHPGNHYRATRTEPFRIDTTLGVNPEAAIDVDFDADPKISGLFGGVNKHNVSVSLSPKYFGVRGGYTVSLEEIGGRNAEMITASVASGELQRNEVKKVAVSYKLRKDSKGKQTILRVSVKNGDTLVKTMDLSIIPK